MQRKGCSFSLEPPQEMGLTNIQQTFHALFFSQQVTCWQDGLLVQRPFDGTLYFAPNASAALSTFEASTQRIDP